MSRRNRDRSPDRSPDPPGRDSPSDVSRRLFKQTIDALFSRFMLAERDAAWAEEPVPALHAKQMRKFARFLTQHASAVPTQESRP